MTTKVKSEVQTMSKMIDEGEYVPEEIVSNIQNYTCVYSIDLSDGSDKSLKSAIKKLSKSSAVLYVGLDYIYEIERESISYSLNSIEVNETLNNYDDIALADAWSINASASSVRVGVIDGGVNCVNPILQDNTNQYLCRDFTTEEGEDDACDHWPEDFHGSMVAGVIGAVPYETTNVHGICQEVELVSLKASVKYGADERTKGSWVIAAVEYAMSIDCDIINISLGWYVGNDDYDPNLQHTLSCFDGLIVVAAGNKYRNLDVVTEYPVEYNLSNMIVVGATNKEDNGLLVTADLSKGSNYSSTKVDVFAPGEDIVSARSYSANVYTTVGDGTSFAAPMVAGVAALMLAVNPELSPEDIIEIITYDGHDDMPALSDKCVSGGRLNAYKAVLHARAHTRDGAPEESDNKCTFNCTQCDILLTFPHELYMASEAEDEYIANCMHCNYSVTCNCYMEPEYYGTDTSGHRVDCPSGCFSFFEAHECTYVQSYTELTHLSICVDCGYSFEESHYWVECGSSFMCIMCLLFTSTMPMSDNDLSTE